MRRSKMIVIAAVLLAATLSTGCRDSLGPSDSPRPSFETQGADN